MSNKINQNSRTIAATNDEVYYDSYHILGFKGHGRCVNIHTNSTAVNGDAISMYDWTNHNDQKWTLRRVGEDNIGFYTFVLESEHGGLYLGYNGTTYEGYKSCNLTNDMNNALICAEDYDVSRGLCWFRMTINGVNHYLTATAGTNGSRLVWIPGYRSYDQIWMFVNGTAHPYSHPSPAYDFTWPASSQTLVTDGYNGLWRLYTDDPNVTRDHDGIDTSVGNGYCYSIFDGTVVEVHNQLTNNRGRYVKIRSEDNRYEVLYQHLASINVAEGEITKGTIVGRIGGSGRTENQYPVHLHFEFEDLVNGLRDPLTFF